MSDVDQQEIEITPELAEVFSGACYCLALRKTARRLNRIYDAALDEYGLSIAQFGLLSWVAASDAPTVQYLARRMAMDQSALSRGLAPLERDGLIRSAADPDDGRKRILCLTDAGRARLTAAAKGWKQAQDRVDTGHERDAMQALMRDVAALGRG